MTDNTLNIPLMYILVSDWHMEYIAKTWMDSRVSPPPAWSVYKQVRTNNDVEGWHYRLHAPQLANIYQIIQLLHKQGAHYRESHAAVWGKAYSIALMPSFTVMQT